jgi:hypothetical protein
MVAHLERMMANRYGNHEEEQAPPQRPLNTGDIFENVEFFTEPIIPVVPVVPVQEVAIEEPPKVEEAHKEVQVVEMEMEANGNVNVELMAQVEVEEQQVQEILENIVPGVNEHIAQDDLPDLIHIPDHQPIAQE